MDWILLLVWITLISSYNCRHHHGYDYPHYGYGAVSRFDYDNYGPRWSDRESYASEENDRISQRSAERDFERPRQNERSIAVDSEIQRVQDEERKRLQDRKRVDDSVPRTENGSSKIVHLPVLTNRRGQLEERPSSEDSVVFPGPTRSKRQYVPEVPESCKAIGICANVSNYPTELAAAHIARLGEKRGKLTVDQIDPEIEQRVGTSNIELCRYSEEVMIPQAAPSKDGEWYFVLNDVKNPLQGYRVEICNNTGGACDNGIAIFNKKYHATCRQKYVQRFMTVIDKAGEVKYDMPLRVPSCCSCVATYNGK